MLLQFITAVLATSLSVSALLIPATPGSVTQDSVARTPISIPLSRRALPENSTSIALGWNQSWTAPLLGVIQVGENRTNFTVTFDTGSSDLWIPSSNCTGCGGMNEYVPSANAKKVNGSVGINYQDGSGITGTTYLDTVQIGNISVPLQPIGAMSSLSQQTNTTSGVFGLGFPVQSQYTYQCVTNNCSTWLWSARDNGIISKGVFGITLKENYERITIGGIDEGAINGSVTYSPLVANQSWMTTAQAINVDNVTYNCTNHSAQCATLFDTGTTMIIGPTKVVDAMVKLIPGIQSLSGTGYYIFPCNATKNPSSAKAGVSQIGTAKISFTFGGKAFDISWDSLNVQPLDTSFNAGEGMCVFGIMGDDRENWILGDIFLKNFYTVFDIDNNQIGLADLVAYPT